MLARAIRNLLGRPKPQPDQFAAKLRPQATITMKIIRANGTVENGPPVIVESGVSEGEA